MNILRVNGYDYRNISKKLLEFSKIELTGDGRVYYNTNR